MSFKTLCIFGTRPEAIKMAPLIQEFNLSPYFQNKVCVTGQHQVMLDSVLDLFAIKPDFNLGVMAVNQNLSNLTARILSGLTSVFEEYYPELILVHGDTTTTLAASLSAYYHQIPVAHIEAGLRTGNKYAPWPEEINRKLTAALATFHFAPTQAARQNLLQENIAAQSIFVTGNTVIDALLQMKQKTESLSPSLTKAFPFLNDHRKMILVTGHRRENFGEGIQKICKALIEICKRFPQIDVVYPLHLNPNVQDKVKPLLEPIPNIYLIPPLDYLSFVFLMKKSYCILTDSGGIQEEAPALHKPVLVMRETTERKEAIHAGTALLVGTDVATIVHHVSNLLVNKTLYHNMSRAPNPYGDGQAAQKIVQILTRLILQNPADEPVSSTAMKEEITLC